MRQDEKFTSYEATCMFSITSLHLIFSELMPNLVGMAGSAAWISQIVGSVISLLLLLLVLLLLRQHQGLDLVRIIEKVYGRIIGKLILAAFAVYALAYVVAGVSQVVETLQIYAYTEMSSLRIDLFLMGALAVLAVYSAKGLAKAISVFFPVILLALALILILCYRQYDMDLLNPILGYGPRRICEYGVYLASGHTGLLMVAFFGNSFKSYGAYKKSALHSVGLASVATVISVLCYNMAVPYASARVMLSGILDVAQANHNSRFLQRLESVFIMITVMAVLLMTGVAFLAAKKIYCGVFSIDKKHSAAVIIPLALLVICGLRTIGNIQEVKRVVRFQVRRYAVIYLFVFLAVTLLVGYLRSKIRRGQGVRRGLAAMLLAACIPAGLLSGCTASYREPDSSIYPVIIGYDRGEKEKCRITMKFMQLGDKGGGESGGSEEPEKSVSDAIPPDIMVFEAPTFTQGINLANALMPKQISMLHVKMLVLSEEIARDGISSLVAPLSRYNEIKSTMAVVVSKAPAYEFIAAEKATLTDSLQMDMELILEPGKESTVYQVTTMGDLLDNYYTTYGDPIVMYGNVNGAEYKDKVGEGESPPEQIGHTNSSFEDGYLAGDLPVMGHSEMELAGMAVFRYDKMVGTLNTKECLLYSMMADQTRGALVSFPDMDNNEHYVTIQTRRVQPVHYSTHVDEDGTAHVTIKISINGVVSMTQGLDVDYLNDPGARRRLEQYTAGIMKEDCEKLVRKLQEEYQADILQIGRRVARNFTTIPQWETYNWREKYPEAKIDVEFQMNL